MAEQLGMSRIEDEADASARANVILRTDSWGWLPSLAMISACGLFAIAWANTLARVESSWAPALQYFGLLVLFAPAAIRLISSEPSRQERIGLVLILGMGLYITKVLSSPAMFTRFDELLHWRTTQDIIESGHLFSANSLLPISPLYPGLEIVTSAIIWLTGLTIFQAGLIVIGVSRLLLVLALFLLFEEVSDSHHIGGIAALIYMTNPEFVIFDAQFAYESLALALGIFALFLVARRLKRHETQRGVTLAILLVLGAIGVTHHLTSFAIAAFLILVAIIEFRLSKARDGLGWIVIIDVVAISTWLFLVAPGVLNYLKPYTVGAVELIIRLLLNEVTARPLFTDYAGQSSPVWERVVAFASIILIIFGLPFGIRQIWRQHHSNVLALALGLASLIYIVGLPLRLLPRVGDVSARSAAFLFLAIGFVLAFAPSNRSLDGGMSQKWVAIGSLGAVVLFLGGFILGAGPQWARLPGPYLVSADARSIEPQGIAAAYWARDILGPGNRVGADRINSLLMGSYGLQHSITHIGDNVDISPLFFSPDFGVDAQATLAFSQMRYAVVDRRLSAGLPRLGVYFESGEIDSYLHKTPIPSSALSKFDQIEKVNRVFDSGDIVIYDLGAWYAQP
jgi:hypothetical protein